jgi:hypothetical protein
MSSSSIARRPAAVAAAAGGLTIAVLGVVAALDLTFADGVAWFLVAAVAAVLLAVATLGLRTATAAIAFTRAPLAVAAAALVLFGLAHVATLIDVDTAILFFSVFMVVAAVGLIIAGVAIARAWRGPSRFVPLLCGLWPVATIPAGAALGDVPHFFAIAVWGLCWIALGAVLWVPSGDRTLAWG